MNKVISLVVQVFAFTLGIVASPRIISEASSAEESDVTPSIVITLRGRTNQDDPRFTYEQDLIKLALEKTKEEYGDYEIRYSLPMNFPRTYQMARKNALPNFFFKTSFRPKLNSHLVYPPVPVDLGIIGYRICFISKTLKNEMQPIKSIEDLKAYTIGQGQDWPDVNILKTAGMKVVTAPRYDNLFPMVATGRFDLFCRGVNEIQAEWNIYSEKLDELDVEESFVLYYPFPRYFWTNPKNTLALERITAGLQTAYQDNSMQALWEEHNMASIKFSNLEKRTLIPLTNPDLQGIAPGFEDYFYKPKVLD